MSTPIAIVGGNIAGLSSAYHLARRGCPVRIFEPRVWDKPCGGAVSIEFARYLMQELGLCLNAAAFPPLPVRLSFNSGRHVDSRGFFVIIDRHDLQKQLMEKLSQQPGIEIIAQRAPLSAPGLFSAQNILAAGYGGFTRRVLGDQWHHREYSHVVKYGGPIHEPLPRRHLIVFDSRIKGYGWVFIEPGNRFNAGMGGMVDRKVLDEKFKRFLCFINVRFGYKIELSDQPPMRWKVPMSVRVWDRPVAFTHNDKTFIGTGDALGLAHPVIAAGIEPAWLSGWLAGESLDPKTTRIDISRYCMLLEQSLRRTCRKKSDLLMAAIVRTPWFPLQEEMAYLLLKLSWKRVLKNLSVRPWFKPADIDLNSC